MKIINQIPQPNLISFMWRPEDGKQNLLKLNVRKDFEEKIEVGDFIYSHSTNEIKFYYEIKEIIEVRQSSMKSYNYCTYVAEKKKNI